MTGHRDGIKLRLHLLVQPSIRQDEIKLEIASLLDETFGPY